MPHRLLPLYLFVAAIALSACSGRVRAPHGSDGRAGPGTCSDGTPRFVVQEAHTKLITKVALSGDGSVLVSAGAESALRIWDTNTGLLLRRVPTRGPAETLALSATGDVVAYAFTPGFTEITVVDLASSAEPITFEPGGAAYDVSPNGRVIVKTIQGGVGVYDTRTGDEIETLRLGPVAAIAFHRSGRFFAVARRDDLALVDATTWKVVREWPHGLGQVPFGLLFAGDSLVVRSAIIGVTSIKGEPTRLLPPTVRPQQIAAGGGNVYFTGIGGEISILDAATGAIRDLPRGEVIPHGLAGSADGSTLAIVSESPDGGHAIRLHDARTMEPIRSMEGKSMSVAALAVRPDGAELVVAAGSGAVTRWDLKTGAMLGQAKGAPLLRHAAAMAPQAYATWDERGEILAAPGANGGVRLLDRDLRVVKEIPTGEMVGFAGFMPRSHNLITAGQGGVRKWDTSTGAGGQPVTNLPAAIVLAEPSPDGTALAFHDRLGVGVVGLDGRVRWHENAMLTGLGFARLGWSADGASVLLSSAERYDPGSSTKERPTLRVFDARTGSRGRTLEIDTMGPISGRGDVLAVGGAKPVLLSWPSGEVRARIAVPDQDVTAIAWHPRADLVYLGGDGGSTSVVSTRTGKLLAMLNATSNGEYVAATPSGAFRASVDGARSVGWSFDCPLEGFSFQQFAAKFDRPDLVAKAVAGEEVAAPATLKRPPRVRLAEGASTTTTERAVHVKASVTAGGTVDKVRVFVNGRAAAERPVGSQSGDVDLEVPLSVGRNRLSVIAYDTEGFASNPRVLDVVSSAKAAAPDLWIVSLGVSAYPKLKPEQQLEVADDDARSIAEAFSAQAGPSRPFAHVHATTLVDRQVTVQAAERALAGLAAMKPDDFAVVFLAGHGTRLKDGQSVFLTSDAGATAESVKAGGIGWDRLRGALAKARGRVLVLLDACHSGHVTTENLVPNEALAKDLVEGDRAGVLVFAAARGAQLSYEVSTGSSSRGLELAWGGKPPPATIAPFAAPAPPRAPTGPQPTPSPKAGGHGLFTAAVLEALAGSAPDRDKSHAIEVGEFVAYVTERVRAASNGAQTPWVARQELFGDFAIAPAR